MSDSWDAVLVGILRIHPDDSMRFTDVVNLPLKYCRPVDRANRELVKKTLIYRLTVLRQANIICYIDRRYLRLLVREPVIIHRPFDPSKLPEPDLR